MTSLHIWPFCLFSVAVVCFLLPIRVVLCTFVIYKALLGMLFF